MRGNVDIRIPIGLLFAIIGALLLIFGLVSDPAIYKKSLGINVNAIWGGVMLASGVVTLLLTRTAEARSARKIRSDA